MPDVEVSTESKQFCLKLIDLLRRLGPELVRGDRTLSLSLLGYQHVQSCLHALNSHSQDLHALFRLDLETLENILGRVQILSLTGRSDPEKGWINLEVLKLLTELELKQVSISEFSNLQSLAGHLTSLKICWSEVDVEDVLAGVRGVGLGAPWVHLTTLVLSHNNLTQLSSALSLTPHLHTLDATHNHIYYTPGLICLNRLHSLYLSFNSLTKIPVLSSESNLTTLSLGYNRLETISGLENILTLECLDLSGNCLMHHDVLAPVSALSRLRQLDTRYNPLSTHPLHRNLTSSWFHVDTVNIQFILDTLPLSKREMVQVGSSRLIVSPRPPVDLSEGFDLESASARGSREGSIVSGVTVTTVGGEKQRRKKRRRRIREAPISDHPSETDYTTTTDAEPLYEQRKDSPDPVKQLEQLREKFGEENWLREQAGATLNQILGLPAVPQTNIKKPVLLFKQPSVEATTDQKPEIKTGKKSKTKKETKTDSCESPSPVECVDPPVSVQPAQSEAQVEVHQKPSPAASTRLQKTSKSSLVGDEMTDSFYSMYRRTEKESSPAGPDRECRLSAERVIPGDDSGVGEKLVLTIDSEYIREQGEKGGTRVKWFLHSLEGCDMLKCEGGRITAHLMFNTVRRDRRERTYILSEEGYARLVSATGSLLEELARDMGRLTHLQCVKCQSIFSQELEAGRRRKKSLEVCCINCGSNMVIECEPSQLIEDEVSVGIPVCEALDLDAMDQQTVALSGGSKSTPEKTYLTETGVLKKKRESENMSIKVDVHNHEIKVDVHNHEIKDPDDNLPDLLPRQAIRETSLEKNRSIEKLRSESSSDISVISDNSIETLNTESSASEERKETSPSSIEVLDGVDDSIPEGEDTSNNTYQSIPAASLITSNTMSGSGSTMMQESSSSGSLVNSVILNTKQGADGNVVSEPNSPKKKDNDRSSEDDSVYHSCVSQDETYQVSATDISGTTPTGGCITPTRGSETPPVLGALDISGITLTLGDASLSSTPTTVRNRSGSLNTSTPATGKSKSGSPGFPRSRSELSRSLRFFSSASPSSPGGEKIEKSSPNIGTLCGEEMDPSSASKPSAPYRKGRDVMVWNDKDFSQVDHRIQLFCEINLFHEEEEDLLIIAQGDVFVKSINSWFPGVLILTNKKIYALRAESPETEEPSDWLEQVSSAPLSRLQRLVQLLGGQGVALELSGVDAKPPPALYFSRMGSGAGYYYSGLGGEDCFYLVLGDSMKVQGFIDQTVDILQERVRSNPIPVVTELNQEEEELLMKQIKGSDETVSMLSFQLAQDEKGHSVSVICASNGLFLAQNFFSWVFLGKKSKLEIYHNIPVENISGLDIYQSMVESISLHLEDTVHHLTLGSESALQRFVRGLRAIWEKKTGRVLEDITSFHPTGSKSVLKMTTLMEESVSFKDFDFSQWIRVTSRK